MFQKVLIPFLATLLAIALICGGLIRDGEPQASESPSPPWTQATVDNPLGSYRFTVNGWEETAHWRIDGEESKVKFIDQVHPLIWMLFVALLAIGLAILASDEASVKRLWRNKAS